MLTYTADDLEKIFREENINPDELQNMVVEKLTKNNLKLATAESCTGGLLSGRITAVSGASEVFDCGVCSYANKIKHKVLGVSEENFSAQDIELSSKRMFYSATPDFHSPLADASPASSYVYPPLADRTFIL